MLIKFKNYLFLFLLLFDTFDFLFFFFDAVDGVLLLFVSLSFILIIVVCRRCRWWHILLHCFVASPYWFCSRSCIRSLRRFRSRHCFALRRHHNLTNLFCWAELFVPIPVCMISLRNIFVLEFWSHIIRDTKPKCKNYHWFVLSW